MALKKTVAKLNAYYERLEDKKAKKIKVKHVDQVLAKLKAKEAELDAALDAASKSSRKDRLKRKRKMVRDQIHRAEFLRTEIKKAK